jgi:two-component system alkaline phosphatase synthesis response regulator PhoP
MSERILVVDDDPQIVRLLRAYLEQSGYHVFAAYSGNEAMRILRAERPDLVLLDLMLPDRDGWAVTRTVRDDPGLAATPIVMLTAIVGLELGADDYISKPFNPREVLARVRAVLRRAQGKPVQSKVIEVGALRLDLERQNVQVEGERLILTPTEFELLAALAQHVDRTLTRSELIDQGLGYNYEGLERTIDSHIKNLRRKVDRMCGDGAGADMIETVFGVGYRLRSLSCGTEEGQL